MFYIVVLPVVLHLTTFNLRTVIQSKVRQMKSLAVFTSEFKIIYLYRTFVPILYTTTWYVSYSTADVRKSLAYPTHKSCHAITTGTAVSVFSPLLDSLFIMGGKTNLWGDPLDRPNQVTDKSCMERTMYSFVSATQEILIE
jgi:hypothetical protein